MHLKPSFPAKPHRVQLCLLQLARSHHSIGKRLRILRWYDPASPRVTNLPAAFPFQCCNHRLAAGDVRLNFRGNGIRKDRLSPERGEKDIPVCEVARHALRWSLAEQVKGGGQTAAPHF